MVLALGLVWGLGSAVAASESPTPTLNGGSASPAPGASAAAGKVVYKVGWTRPPDNLNPFIGYAAPAFEIWYLTYDSLVGYDPKTLAPMKGEASTGLATDWSTSADGLTWTFTIRQNAKWDDGQPLTAKDIAFTYNYVIQNKMENYTAYTNLIETATAVDDYTVEFQLLEAQAGHDPPLAAHPARAHLVDGRPEGRDERQVHQQPALRGLRSLQGRRVEEELARAPGAEPELVGPEAQDRRDLLHAVHEHRHASAGPQGRHHRRGRRPDGDADEAAPERAGPHRSRDHRRRLRRPRLQLLRGPQQGPPRPSGREVQAGAQLGRRPRQDRGPRLGGTTTAGTTIIPPNYYHDPDWHWEPPADVKYTYDPAIANQKLDEAGYPDADGDGVREYKGKPIELGLIARDESVQSQQTGKLIVGWFKDVGITVKLEVMDEATLGDRELNYEGDVFTPDFDMFLWGWYLDYDPGSMLSYLTKGQIENWNETCWWDPEYEKLYVQQGQELDAAKRKPLIDRMQQILYEQTPYIVTDYGPDFEAYNTAKWEGYIQIPSPNGNTLLPPFGNGGYANFLSIGPKAAATTEAARLEPRPVGRRRGGCGGRGDRRPSGGALAPAAGDRRVERMPGAAAGRPPARPLTSRTRPQRGPSRRRRRRARAAPPPDRAGRRR